MGRKILFTFALTALAATALAASACSNGGSGGPASKATPALQSNSQSTNSANTRANANANTNFNSAVTRAEYEQNKDEYMKAAEARGERVGTGVEDGWLWVKTKARLAVVSELKDADIKVDVENGAITLRGNVGSEEQSKKAEEAAEQVSKRVDNRLVVKTDDPVQTLPTPTPTPKR